MEVTKQNFLSTLPIVEEAIEGADFVSIDTEFTGLTNLSEKYHLYEHPRERYKKLLKNTKGFIQIQFGLCTFKWNKEENKYETKAFNFYIFPFTLSPSLKVPDKIFSCQSSSIDFLASQGFDFNKTFYKGIPYLTANEEESLRKCVDDKKEKLESNTDFTSRFKKGNQVNLKGNQKAKDFIKDVQQQVQEFIDNPQLTEMDLKPCNSFYRRVLHEHIPSKFDERVFLDYKNTNGRRHLVVHKGPEAKYRMEKQALTIKKNEESFHDAVGFSKVMKMLTNKLVVGHNMLYDVMYSVRQYVHELPETLDDFKNLFPCVFSNVVDTKLMCNMIPFNEIIGNTALNDMYLSLKKEPFTQVKLDAPLEYLGKDSDLEVNLHQAAYDAYITGYSYLLMFKHLNSFLDEKNKSCVASSSAHAVQPYLNKINLTHMHEVPYINMTGEDLQVNYDDVFYMTFPQEWKTMDIREKFAPFTINISWINQTSCFVRIMEKHQVKAAQKMIFAAMNAHFKVLTYKTYSQQLNDNDVTPTKPVTSPMLSRKRSMDDVVMDVSCGVSGSKKMKTTTTEEVKENKVFNVSDNWD